MDQRVLAPPHGFSQRATSFIASIRQGIHQMPFSRLISAAFCHDAPYPHAPLRDHGCSLRRRASPSGDLASGLTGPAHACGLWVLTGEGEIPSERTDLYDAQKASFHTSSRDHPSAMIGILKARYGNRQSLLRP